MCLFPSRQTGTRRTRSKHTGAMHTGTRQTDEVQTDKVQTDSAETSSVQKDTGANRRGAVLLSRGEINGGSSRKTPNRWNHKSYKGFGPQNHKKRETQVKHGFVTNITKQYKNLK